MKGAAIGNAGFHTFLSSYLEWELPEVPTFEGGDRILYLQTITPLYLSNKLRGGVVFIPQFQGVLG